MSSSIEEDGVPQFNGELCFQFESPVRVGSGHGFAWRFDHTITRDVQGLPIIPASTIKGRLRFMCQQVALTLDDKVVCQTMDRKEPCRPEAAGPCIICRMFGSRFREGALRFSDAKLSPEEGERLRLLQVISPAPFFPEAEPRTQVKLSRVRRVAEPQFLFCGEVAPMGLIFTSQVRGFLETGERELFTWGLGLLTHLGAQKARGLGRCTVSLTLR